jgi:hypothetical protein
VGDEVAEERDPRVRVHVRDVGWRVSGRVGRAELADCLGVGNPADRHVGQGEAPIVEPVECYECVASGPRRQSVAGDGRCVQFVAVHGRVEFRGHASERADVVGVVVVQQDAVHVGRGDAGSASPARTACWSPGQPASTSVVSPSSTTYALVLSRVEQSMCVPPGGRAVTAGAPERSALHRPLVT